MEMGRVSKKVKWIIKSDLIKTEKAKREADWKARQEKTKKQDEVFQVYAFLLIL